MKSFRMFFRSFRDAFKSVVRNFSLSLASVACITITLIIIAFALVISYNVRNFTEEIKRDVTIVAFLDSNIDDEERKSFESELKSLTNVNTYQYKSKGEIKDEMAKGYEELADILNDWDDNENPLKDSYTIKVVDVEQINGTANTIKELKNVSNVQYGEGLIEKLLNVFDTAEKITYVAAISLAAVTIFLIINTIKLTIFSRKREISIMRLVGASNMRVKLPFVVEGIVLGIIGSIVPIISVIYGYDALYNSVLDSALFSSTIQLIKPAPFVYEISLVILAIGILVGMFGSSRAVRRYIKG